MLQQRRRALPRVQALMYLVRPGRACARLRQAPRRATSCRRFGTLIGHPSGRSRAGRGARPTAGPLIGAKDYTLEITNIRFHWRSQK